MKTDQATLPQEDTILALMYAEIKKLTKHFKLDRHSRNAPDDPAASEVDDDEKLRSIVREQVSEVIQQREYSPAQIERMKGIAARVGNLIIEKQAQNLEPLKKSVAELGQKLDTIAAAPQATSVQHKHCFVLDFQNSRAALAMTVMALTIFISAVLHVHQLDKIRSFRDNDLKYRHIQMHGTATPVDIERIRNIFDWNRNTDSIRIIRRQVEQYERLVQQEAEKSERARLNSAEAERLKKEAEAVKGKK